MGLADDLLVAPPADKSCPFPAILEALEPRDAEALRYVLQPKMMEDRKIMAALRRSDIKVTFGQLADHKRGACTCRSRTS